MSTLTPEQIEAVSNALISCGEALYSRSVVTRSEAAIFLAGCRYQHERTREAAANRCGEFVLNVDDCCDGVVQRCAEAIRALTLDEC